MNRLKPIGRYVLLSVLALLIGLNVYTLNATRLAGNQVPMPFGIGASVVLSGSMEPALSVGDLLIVREAENYEVGDIVVYQSGRIAVVHRITAIHDDDTVTTQGDANNAADEPIPMTAICGKVVVALPLVGYVAWAMKSPIAVLLMLVAAVLLIELSFRETKEQHTTEQDEIKAEIRKLMEELKED